MDTLGLSQESSIGLVIRATGAPHMALAFERFATIRGARAKIAYTTRKLVPPKTVVRS
jgi:hypothetical protein